MKIPSLVILLGPTGVGKTALSLELAKRFQTEIISADSRQIYKGLDIGTAKPSLDELKAVPHHFIGCFEITKSYSAGAYAKDALKLMDELFKKHDVLIMAGGSGLYIKAVCEGFDEVPQKDDQLREKLNREFEKSGLDPLLNRIKRLDPDFFKEVDQQNHRRVIRALEVIELTGKPYSQIRSRKKVSRPFIPIKIGLTTDRKELYQRIDQRMDWMIEKGLFDEAERYFDNRDQPALQTVGYQEIFDFMLGKYDQEEAIRLLKRNSRRYAKRQLTWFNKDPEVTWFDPGDKELIFEFIVSKIEKPSD